MKSNGYKKYLLKNKITKKEFNHIQDIMISAGELDKKAPYDKLVYKGK